ncbi:MAG: TlpA disulfide reductase family protein [Candidatus Margulisiibacteriota bacterium]
MIFSNKKILIGFIITFLIGLNIYNIPLKGQEEKRIPIAETIYTPPKGFNLSNLEKELNKINGSSISFNEYKKIIVTFWATWCPSCNLENKIFNEVHKKYNDELLIISISVDKDPNALAEYIKETPLNFIAINNTKEIALMFDDILAVPTHYIIDIKSGALRKTMGLMDKNEIKNIMGEKI